jgi:hypothetical protein
MSKNSKPIKQDESTSIKQDKNTENRNTSKRSKNRGRGNNSKQSDNSQLSSLYYMNENMGSSIANIPYNVMGGMPFGYNKATISGAYAPSVLVVEYAPWYVTSNQALSAVNQAARAVYTFVRHKNSGHSNYESSDLMMYILAMNEVYIKYFEAKRHYEILCTYTYENKNVPHSLLKAIGGSVTEASDLAVLRYQLNYIAAQISSMAVPNVFNLFKRHAILSSNVFTDDATLQGQFYIYHYPKRRVFNPTDDEAGGFLESKSAKTTLYGRIEDLQMMLYAIIPDEDMNIISGDILKAYGKENLYVIPEVQEYSTVQFVQDMDILEEIHNSKTYANIFHHDLHVKQLNNAIYQDTSPTIIQPEVSTAAGRNKMLAVLAADFVLNSPIGREYDWKQVLSVTRSTNCLLYAEDGKYNAGVYIPGKTMVVCGSEMILGYRVITQKSDGSYIDQTFYSLEFDKIINTASGRMLEITSLLTPFKFAPQVLICIRTTDDPDSLSIKAERFAAFSISLDRYTQISQESIATIHDSVMLALLGAKSFMF